MTHSSTTIALNTLKRTKAERLVFDRLWTAFDGCDPKLMVTPDTQSMIEAMRGRIVAGEPFLRADADTLMAHLRIEPDPKAKIGRGPFICVQLAWFFGFIAGYIERNGDRTLPMSVAVEALCDASDNLFATVHRSGTKTTLRVIDSDALGLSGTLDITNDGPAFEPPTNLRSALKKTFGVYGDTLSDKAA